MPELPEVEVIRRGVDHWATGRTIGEVEVRHPRAIRRHLGNQTDFAGSLAGASVIGTSRRGKFFWLVLDTGDLLVVHLGMSGQMLVQPPTAADEIHLRVLLPFSDAGPQLRFVDQRTFGGLFLDEPIDGVPSRVAHIARDPFDPEFDAAAVARVIHRRSAAIKSVILDQTVVSGIGNIYADESLWRARLNWARPANRIALARIRDLLDHAQAVMAQALGSGGTSFDSLYVNVNGSSGYFSRSLAAYGRHGNPCPRCGTPIIRERFTNRSSFRCPKCQR